MNFFKGTNWHKKHFTNQLLYKKLLYKLHVTSTHKQIKDSYNVIHKVNFVYPNVYIHNYYGYILKDQTKDTCIVTTIPRNFAIGSLDAALN